MATKITICLTQNLPNNMATKITICLTQNLTKTHVFGRFWVNSIVILVAMFFGRFWVKHIVILVAMFFWGGFGLSV
jgi:hypothetical protein